MRGQDELRMAIAIGNYIKMQYKDAVYHFDTAGMNLSKVQAAHQKMLNPQRGFPDLIIFVKSARYTGLAIELKKEGTKLMKVRSTAYASEHIGEQAKWLDLLEKSGFKTCFAAGFDEAKAKIDEFMKEVRS